MNLPLRPLVRLSFALGIVFGLNVGAQPPASLSAPAPTSLASSEPIPAGAAVPGRPFVVQRLQLAFAPIAAGTFLMGTPKSEVGRAEEEGPQTQVTISRPFWLGQCEVSHGQWQEMMGTDLREQVRRMLADDTRYDMGGMKRTERDYFFTKKDANPDELLANTDTTAPMQWVNWMEATAFCAKLSAVERQAGRLPAGYEYRLPTEAEWEYACRGGTTAETYAGKLDYKGKYNVPALDAIAWYSGNSSIGYVGRGWDTAKWPQKQSPGGTAGPRAVGTKQPNPWGLYDMLGNVNEWCNDWFAGNLQGGRLTDPIGGTTGHFRVYRGGAWIYNAANCRAGARRFDEPGIRREHIGFRVALAPPIDRLSTRN